MATQYDRAPEMGTTWHSEAEFSEGLAAPLRRIGILDAENFLTEASIPIQIRAGYLDGSGEGGSPEANRLIEAYAARALQGMPEGVRRLLRGLDPLTPSYERGACEDAFGDTWRFGQWASDTDKRRLAPLGGDLLVRCVVDQILLDRHNRMPGAAHL